MFDPEAGGCAVHLFAPRGAASRRKKSLAGGGGLAKGNMRSMKDNPPSSNTDLWCCGCVRSNVAQELLAAAAALTLLRRLQTPASRIWHLNTYE